MSSSCEFSRAVKEAPTAVAGSAQPPNWVPPVPRQALAQAARSMTMSARKASSDTNVSVSVWDITPFEAIKQCTRLARMVAGGEFRTERGGVDYQRIQKRYPCAGVRSSSRQTLYFEKLAKDLQSNNNTMDWPSFIPMPCEESECLDVHDQEAELTARNSSVAFGFITRDGMDYMKRNLGFMMRLGSMFARFWLLFSENDSTDGTKEFLAEYGRRYPQVQGDLLQGESNLYSVRLCPKSRRNCPARVKLLSRMRQLVYERALRLLDAMDAFIMVDIDFLSVDIRSFLQMFYAGRRLSAAAIAGQSMYRNSREDCQAYDTSALVPYAAPLNAIKKYCFGRIHSAFGGLTIYFADALREASPKPSYTWWNDSDANDHIAILNQAMRLKLKDEQYTSFLLSNEHRPMNLRLSHWGMRTGRPFLVDPRFRPMYNWGETKILVLAKERVRLEREYKSKYPE